MLFTILILVHVASSFFWGGGVLIGGLFFVPSIMEAGPGGGAVMAGVIKRHYTARMTGASIVAIVSGIWLYALRFSPAWALSPEGLVLALGGLLALSAWGIGTFRQKPLALAMGALAREGRHHEIPPLAAKLERHAKIAAWHVVAVILLMAGHSLASAF
jgi:hypothetical protein